MATSQQRELMAQLEDMGYAYKGHDRQNAVVMYHPVGGAVRVHASISDNRGAMNLIQEARRKLRIGKTRYGHFVDWLMDKHGIGRADQKALKLNMRDEAREYVATHPEAGRMESLVATVDQDPRLEVLDRRQGMKMGMFKITGPDFGIDNLLEGTTPERDDAIQVDNNNPMEAVIDQLRHMMMAEMNGELEDLRAKHDLTVETLSHLLEALKQDRQGTAA